jgi:hypothetical protein
MLMDSSMTPENAITILSSISLELNEGTVCVCVKRVEMSWYESDLSSNRGGGRNLNFLEFFLDFLEL